MHIIKTGSGLLMISGKSEGLFPSRPAIYICFILCSVIAASGYKLRTQTIFACQATLYNSDRYIAYCNGARYADYEHGAFWFDLARIMHNAARFCTSAAEARATAPTG